VLRTSLREAAAKVAGNASSAVLTMLGVAVLAVAAGWIMPAEAQQRKAAAKPAEEAIPDPADGQPMTLVVSLSNQKVDIYRGTTLVTSSNVSTGMRGYATKAGIFTILEKKRMHHSNLYSGAPMPWMQRITWSGTALHAGVVPGYPASHGCIRLPFSFAPKLFGITNVGEHVVVTRNRIAPEIIEHANLFQPLPPPNAPALVKQDNPPQRQSSLEAPSSQAKDTALPVILVKADTGSVKIDRMPAFAAETVDGAPARTQVATAASTQAKNAGIVPAEVAPDSASMDMQLEDTHAHAIDPFVGDYAQAGGVAAPAQPSKGHALDETGETSMAANTTSTEQVPPAKAELVQQKDVAPAVTALAAEPAIATPAAPLDPAKNETHPATEPAPAAEVPTASDTAPAPETETLVAEAAPAVPTRTEPDASEPSLPQPDGAQIAETVISIGAAKLAAGTKAAGIQAAEPRSTAPLRILVTRRTQRDRIIGVQQILADMGYLPPLDFDGTLGRASVTAIKEFQKANGLPETGAFTDELVKKVYAAAGKQEPPVGHLFVRQEFGKIFDVPVGFRDPDKPLGTHLFTTMKFKPGDTKTRWMAVSLQGDDPAAVLDRLEIPGDIRQKISERLTPGSSLIIGDTAINSAGLPKGADFLVWATDNPSKTGASKVANSGDNDDVSRPKPKKKPRTVRREIPSYGFSAMPRNFSRGYPSWPW
jgi:L,D-transpeptidase catalytic domain/Putative peptidoglycan binding domain